MDIGSDVRIVGGHFAGRKGTIQGVNFAAEVYYVVLWGEAFEPAVEVAWDGVETQ